MSKDLYAVLGIDRGADQEAVRRAYRQRAKQTHPDAGGSADEFAAVSLANRILGDERARLEYDRTGKTEEPVDNHHAQALSLIHSMIDQFVDGPEDVVCNDLVDLMYKNVDQSRIQANTVIACLTKKIARAQKMRDKFIVQGGDDVIGLMIASKIAVFELTIEGAKEANSVLDKASEILKNYRFEVEPRQRPQWGNIGVTSNIFGGTTTFYR